ncbi:MAG: hypothetical protein JEZ00_04075 [Anaerolineaceae bacterium]|nr:hypothetical protein [Anaerolineaceae bacterium]
MRSDLKNSAEKGGAFYEQDLWGATGHFHKEEIAIGYKEGEFCPVCKTEITKIPTGSTTSYVCETCQPMKIES